MNLILFTEREISEGLRKDDSRFIHIQTILKLKCGDRFDGGIIDGATGCVEITSLSSEKMELSFTPLKQAEPLYGVTLVIGMPRPPTARRLLKDMTSLGIDQIWFTGTELGEKSYLTSKLWRDEKYREYVVEGAQQGESTILPEIRKFHSLKQTLSELPPGRKIALDNNESSGSIGRIERSEERHIIAIGSERGWTENEREMLKRRGFKLCSMGSRVLRTETACSMATGFILAAMGKI